METILEKIKEIFESLLNDSRKTTIVLGTGVGIIFFSYLVKTYINKRNYFKKLNLPGPTPWPILGNFVDVIRNGLIQNDMVLMKKYGKTIGFFEGSNPVVMTIDPRLVKAICIKDFSSFVNRRVIFIPLFHFLIISLFSKITMNLKFILKSIDSITLEPLDKFLTVLKDDEWKNVRAILTTSFTSGKLKLVTKYPFFNSIQVLFLTSANKLSKCLDVKMYFGFYQKLYELSGRFDQKRWHFGNKIVSGLSF